MATLVTKSSPIQTMLDELNNFFEETIAFLECRLRLFSAVSSLTELTATSAETKRAKKITKK